MLKKSGLRDQLFGETAGMGAHRLINCDSKYHKSILITALNTSIRRLVSNLKGKSTTCHLSATSEKAPKTG